MTVNISPKGVEVTMTLQVTRKETGKVEEFHLVGNVTNDEVETTTQEIKENGSHTLSSSS